MTARTRILALTILSLFICSGAAGQVRVTMGMGIGDDNIESKSRFSANASTNYSEIRGIVIDSATLEPIAGALVSIITNVSDIPPRHISTDKKGLFSLKDTRLYRGKLKIEITMFGYKIYASYPESTTQILDLGKIKMSLDAHEIDAVTVKARLSFFTIKGDTIIFNPKAAKVLDGAMASDILRKMPGVEVNGDRVTVMGTEVSRTYVNGKLIYGDSNKGINYVEAGKTSAIQVYDETDAENYIASGEIKKRRVMNILTYDLFSQNIVADAFASYGANANKNQNGKHQARYAGGGGVSLFSEKQELQVDATFGNMNINRNSNRSMFTMSSSKVDSYNRTTDIAANYGRNRYKSLAIPQHDDNTKMQNVRIGSYSIKYSYKNDYALNERTSKTIYFPTDQFKSRIDDSKTRGYTSTKTHSLSVSVSDLSMKFMPSITLSGNLTEDTPATLSNQTTIQDGTNTNGYLHSVNRKINSGDIGMQVMTSTNITKKQTLQINGDAKYSNNNTYAWQIDSLASTQNTKTLKTSAPGQNNLKIGADAQYKIKLTKFDVWNLSYRMEYNNGHKLSTTVDASTGMVDTTLTYNYKENRQQHSITTGITRRFNKYMGMMSAIIGANITSLNRDENFPEPDAYNKLFVTPKVSLSFSNSSIKNTINMDYTMYASTPTTEDIKSRIDAFNPLLLSAGNPNLKPTLWQTLSFRVSRTVKQAVYSFGATTNVISNSFATRRRLFNEKTYLKEYDYTVEQGAMLNDIVNLNGAWSAIAHIGLNTPLSALKSKGNFTLFYLYERRPDILNESKVMLKTSSVKFQAKINTNFSAKFEAEVYSNTEYRRNINLSQNTSNTTIQKCGMVFRSTPFNRMFINASYDFTYSSNTIISSSFVRNHIMNATIGIKLLKNKSLQLSATAYDILNSNNPLIMNVTSYGTTEEWQQVYSRYFTINLSWSMNKKK